MAAQRSSVNSLWHQQYAHLNVHYLSQLAREELVLELPKIQTQLVVCDACQAGKQHRTPFPVGALLRYFSLFMSISLALWLLPLFLGPGISFIYLSDTRPDISFAISYISHFMTASKVDHWMAAKRVLRYVKGTIDYGILYSQSPNPRLSGFINSNWAGSVDDKKSTSRYVFSLGSGAITWTSKKQQEISLSSTEAEYRGTVKAGCEVVWLRRMLGDMQMSPAGPTTLLITKALSS